MAHHFPNTGPTGGPPRSAVIAGVVVVLGLCAMATGLGLAGWKAEAILALVAGVGATAGTLVPLLGLTLNRLDVVAHNTNGGLQQTVVKAVHDAVPPAIQEAVNSGQSTEDGSTGSVAA